MKRAQKSSCAYVITAAFCCANSVIVQQVTALRPGCLKPCEYRAGRVWRRDNCALAQYKPVGPRVSALTTSGLKPATLKDQSEATTVEKHSPCLKPLHQ